MEFWKIDRKTKDGKYKYRIKEISPIEILTIANDIESFASQRDSKFYKAFLQRALELCEVEINGKWLPIKEENRETYWPASIKTDLKDMREIADTFFTEVIQPVFFGSNEQIIGAR